MASKFAKFDRDTRQQVAEAVSVLAWTLIMVAVVMDLSGQPMAGFNRLSTWAWTFGSLLFYEVVVVGYITRTRSRERSEIDAPIIARFVSSFCLCAVMFAFVMINLIRFENEVPYFNNRENGFGSLAGSQLDNYLILRNNWSIILHLTGVAYVGVVYGAVMSHMRNNFIPTSINGRAGASHTQMTSRRPL